MMISTKKILRTHSFPVIPILLTDASNGCHNDSQDENVFVGRAVTWNEHHYDSFSLDIRWRGTETPNQVAINVMKHIDGCDTVLPLHESCLRIGCSVIDYHRYFETSTMNVKDYEPHHTRLNRILQVRFRDHMRTIETSDKFTERDLFDLYSASDTEGPRSVLGLSIQGWLAKDYEVSEE